MTDQTETENKPAKKKPAKKKSTAQKEDTVAAPEPARDVAVARFSTEGLAQVLDLPASCEIVGAHMVDGDVLLAITAHGLAGDVVADYIREPGRLKFRSWRPADD